MSSAKNQKEPLKESVDYPDFAEAVASSVAELVAFIVEDVEGFLLDSNKKSLADLTKVELACMHDFIRERVENGLGGLA